SGSHVSRGCREGAGARASEWATAHPGATRRHPLAILDLVIRGNELLPQNERLAHPVKGVISVRGQHLVANPAPSEVLCHLEGGADAAKWVQNQVVAIGVEADQAVGDLLREGTGMIDLARGDGRDVPDVVGDFLREDAVDLDPVALLVLCGPPL